MSENSPNPLESLLSGFALGPAWARAKSESPKESFKQPRNQDHKPERQGGGRDNRDRRDNRDNRDNRDSRDSRDNRRDGRDNRRDFKRGDRPDFQREEIIPTEGVNVTIVPDKKAIELLCKEIHHVARVYPLFDLANIILADRSRSIAIFEISDKKEPFFNCKFDNAIFTTKEEALHHLLNSPWRDRFIQETTVEVDPPKGNFQSVAKCGISGEWLGPPNYHAYQTEIRRLHRERFSNMPFESYIAKVRTERSEEAVNEWLESMKKQTRWRILSGDEPIPSKEAPPEPPTAITPPEETTPAEEPTSEEPSVENEVTEDTVVDIEAAEAPIENEVAEPSPEPTPTEAPTDDTQWFTDRAELERALSTEVIDKAFTRNRRVKVPSSIVGKLLSPGLLVRLKNTGNHHRKHPAILIPAICKILEAEHMPVFKRKGKLFTGPARPSALDPTAVLAPRPAEMVSWIRENPPAKLEGLWKAVLPEGATAPPAEYAADLFWLLQQGHILLYTDDTLVVQELPKPPEPKKPKAKKSPSEKPPTSDPETPAEPIAEIAETAPESAEESSASELTAESETPEVAALEIGEDSPTPEVTAESATPEPAAEESSKDPDTSSTDH